jgi:effector-binding domain-containing protein
MSFQPLEVRLDAQPYAAIQLRTHRDSLYSLIQDLLAEVYRGLTAHRIAVAGPALVRYLATDAGTDTVDMCVGYPLHALHTPDLPRIHFGTLPAGTYLVLVHKGPHETISATTEQLLAWARAHGVQWKSEAQGSEITWNSRAEHHLVSATTESNPTRWLTEIAILKA